MAKLPPIITKARTRLLVRAPFFGSIALGLAWIEATDIETMATDGRAIWFNTAWCEEHGVDRIMGVIAHEILHVVNNHHLRRGKRDPKLWNIAADLMINRLLVDDRYELPSDLIFDHARDYAGLPTETIYERLLEQQLQKPNRQPVANQSAGAPGAGSPTAPQDGAPMLPVTDLDDDIPF